MIETLVACGGVHGLSGEANWATVAWWVEMTQRGSKHKKDIRVTRFAFVGKYIQIDSRCRRLNLSHTHKHAYTYAHLPYSYICRTTHTNTQSLLHTHIGTQNPPLPYFSPKHAILHAHTFSFSLSQTHTQSTITTLYSVRVHHILERHKLVSISHIQFFSSVAVFLCTGNYLTHTEYTQNTQLPYSSPSKRAMLEATSQQQRTW